jgi:hypothetical protein
MVILDRLHRNDRPFAFLQRNKFSPATYLCETANFTFTTFYMLHEDKHWFRDDRKYFFYLGAFVVRCSPDLKKKKLATIFFANLFSSFQFLISKRNWKRKQESVELKRCSSFCFTKWLTLLPLGSRTNQQFCPEILAARKDEKQGDKIGLFPI